MFHKSLIKIAIVTCSSAIIISCASSSKEIAAAYVSPSKYSAFNCDQLSQELARLNKKKNDLAFELDEKASKDEGLTAVSLILFWPAAFALGGNQEQEAEYARIKGEYDAVQKAGVEKTCDLDPARIQTARIQAQSSSSGPSSAIEFYGEAEEEINTNSYDNDLWAKALVDVEGDETKRKAKYIELRANQLYSEKVGIVSGTSLYEQPMTAQSQIILDFSGNYRSKITGSYRTKSAFIIEQDGNRIKGRSLNNEWEIEGTLEEDSLVFNWWSPGNKGNGKFTVDPYGNMAGSYAGDSWGKGEWILVRNDEPPGSMVIATGSNSISGNQPLASFDLSGTYISTYTGKYLKRSPDFRNRNLQVRLMQDGKKVTGTFGSEGKVWGDIIDGATIRFEIFAAGGYSRRGTWKIDPVNNKLIGKMTSNEAEDWNLTKIE